MNGWIILNKPQGITSTKAGSLVKRALKTKKLGHAGTLDPFATGILPLALGEATKVMPLVVSDIKEYEFELTFGEQRDSDDIEGNCIATTSHVPSADEIKSILPQFIGEISQIPPVYSALKVDGTRACDRVRRGESISLKARNVQINELELIEMLTETVGKFRVVCGTGTYVRSLGRDIAAQLGSLGYLSSLCRSRVGKFSLKNSVNLDIVLQDAIELFKNDNHPEQKSIPWFLSIRDVLDDIPAFPASDSEVVKIQQGQPIPSPKFVDGQTVLIMNDKTELALSVYINGYLYPKKVFKL